jgi:hypothetical protein
MQRLNTPELTEPHQQGADMLTGFLLLVKWDNDARTCTHHTLWYASVKAVLLPCCLLSNSKGITLRGTAQVICAVLQGTHEQHSNGQVL